MKTLATKAALLTAAAIICVFSILKTQGNIEGLEPLVEYSTVGHGPKILLLHDSSKTDLDWAKTAQELASKFEVTFVDISKIINDTQGVQQLRQSIRTLKIDASRIAGSAHGANFALRYALSYPDQTDHFILPQDREDLQILADIVNSTPFTKS